MHSGQSNRQTSTSSIPGAAISTPRGLVFIERNPLASTLSMAPIPPQVLPLNYTEALKNLAHFRVFWKKINHTEEPLLVWITNPKSHTKICHSHFFARGFSSTHSLFLESHHLQRTLALLLQESKRIAIVVLDGYPKDRVVLHMARKWVKSHQAQTFIKADDFEKAKPHAQRLFMMGH